MAKTKVIAVANQKGGVGKSTTVYNLGAGLVLEGKRVLLDCRPSLGMLVINVLSASDYVLIPVQADYLAAGDMTELAGTVQSIKRQINSKLKIGGVFLTMGNETNFGRDIVKSVKENFGKHLPVL